MADNFSADQIEEWKENWELFDAEGQGKIYWNQVGSAIRSFGWAPTNEQWQQTIHVENGGGENEFGQLLPSAQDLDNKQVTFDEFLPILAKVSALPGTGTREDFIEGMKVFDKDSNGYVLGVEIQHILSSLGESLNKKEIDEIFKNVEVNSQGMMKYEDFVNHIMKDPADEE